MRIQQLHSWNLTPREAVALQRELTGRVDTTLPLGKCDIVAGADVSYNRFSPTCYAAVVVLRARDWTIIETQGAVSDSKFPYVPGLLTFREAPILLQAFRKLNNVPDAVILDGQGRAHRAARLRGAYGFVARLALRGLCQKPTDWNVHRAGDEGRFTDAAHGPRRGNRQCRPHQGQGQTALRVDREQDRLAQRGAAGAALL